MQTKRCCFFERVKSWCFMMPSGKFFSGFLTWWFYPVRFRSICVVLISAGVILSTLLYSWLARRNNARHVCNACKTGWSSHEKFPLESLQAIVFSCSGQTSGMKTCKIHICLFSIAIHIFKSCFLHFSSSNTHQTLLLFLSTL